MIKTKIITLKSDVHFIRDKKIKDLLLLEANKASTDKEFQEKFCQNLAKIRELKELDYTITTSRFLKLIIHKTNHDLKNHKNQRQSSYFFVENAKRRIFN